MTTVSREYLDIFFFKSSQVTTLTMHPHQKYDPPTTVNLSPVGRFVIHSVKPSLPRTHTPRSKKFGVNDIICL